MNSDEQKILKRIADNDRSALDKIYIENRDVFLNFFQKYTLTEEEVKDIYQDTIIAFYQRGVQGKIQSLQSSVKTYLFSIGIHKTIDLLRSKSRSIEKIQKAAQEVEMIEWEDDLLTIEQKKLYKQFGKLGESCQRMLILFYYRGLSINEIVNMGFYKDENTVKSHKSKCLKQLLKLVNKKNG